MSHPLTTQLTRVVLVRDGFTEIDIWRGALGPFVPLHACSMAGGFLDAPEWLPAGATRSTSHGPAGVAANRITPWWA